MVTHCITKEQETFIEDKNNTSMMTHQILNICSYLEETVHVSGDFNFDHISPINENEEELSDQESFSVDHHEEITQEDSFDHKDDDITVLCKQSIEEDYDYYEEEIYQINNETE